MKAPPLNKIILGDCLAVLRELPSAFVDLIYLDPPFNTGRDFGDFVDKFASMADYVAFIRARVEECARVLKDTGSIYLHCDPNISHHLRFVLDDVFGARNFRNEIVWVRTHIGKAIIKHKFQNNTDTIIFYAKSQETIFNVLYQPLKDTTHYKNDDKDGKGAYRYGARNPLKKYYLNKNKGVPMKNWWEDIAANIPSCYATQKPPELLSRIIRASSREGDVVLDPFIGSGTTAVAALELGRRYIGIDQNPRAVELARRRLRATVPLLQE